MEMVNNAASAASRAIWGDSNFNTQSGESGTEPVSGKTGNTSIGEPYDAGNLGNSTDAERSSTTENTKENDTSTSGVSSSDTKETNASRNTAATESIQAGRNTDKSDVTLANQPSNTLSSNQSNNSSGISGPGIAPSVSADPASGAQNTQKHQGADRPNDEPNGNEHDRIQRASDEAKKAESVDTSDSGVKPLTETYKTEEAPSPSTNDNDGPQKESHGTGTGEKYVKSTGMRADGGDFDAAKPGAGREANRLLELKGVHRGKGGSSGGDKSDPSEDQTGKLSLGEKIKAKIHKH